MQETEIFKTTKQSQETLSVKRTRSYPFDLLKPGLSFFVKADSVNEGSLRAIVSNAATKKGKIYKCIKHSEEGCFEVAQLDSDNQVSFTIVESSPLAKNQNFADEEKMFYFFDKLPEGKSYCIPTDSVKERVLKTACTKNSERLNCKFVYINHGEVYEVYHVRKDQLVKPVAFFDPSPQAAGLEVRE